MTVLLVGPLPPPIDGRAVATGWLRDALVDRGLSVAVVDTQLPVGRLRPVRKLARCLVAGARVALGPPRPVLVIASGGFGLLCETLPIVAARLRRRPAWLVHHSAAYVRHRSRLMTLVVRSGGPRLRHVLLSEGMRSEFCARYGLDAVDQCVVGNSVLMPGRGRGATRPREGLLHLSNLSPEKGSLVAMNVAAAAGAGIRLAGPATPDVEAAIRAHRESGTAVEWVGPVEGSAKDALFDVSRAFLFPTQYVHEAQPLVLYEAAAAGVVPIAWSAGWIAEQLGALGLDRYVVEPGDVAGLVAAVREVLALSIDDFDRLSSDVAAALERVRAEDAGGLDALVAQLTAP